MRMEVDWTWIRDSQGQQGKAEMKDDRGICQAEEQRKGIKELEEDRWFLSVLYRELWLGDWPTQFDTDFIGDAVTAYLSQELVYMGLETVAELKAGLKEAQEPRWWLAIVLSCRVHPIQVTVNSGMFEYKNAIVNSWHLPWLGARLDKFLGDVKLTQLWHMAHFSLWRSCWRVMAVIFGCERTPFGALCIVRLGFQVLLSPRSLAEDYFVNCHPSSQPDVK